MERSDRDRIQEGMHLLDEIPQRNTIKEALATAHQALDLFEQASDGIGMAKAYIWIGSVYNNASNSSAAIEAFSKAADIQKRTGDTIGLGISMFNMSTCYLVGANYTQALYCAEESIRILSSCVESTKSGRVAGQYIYTNHGWEMQPQRNHEYLADAYVNYGNTLRTFGQLDKALEAYQQAKTAADTANNPSCTAAILNQLGDVLLETGNYTQALTAFRQAYDLFCDAKIKGYAFAVVCQSLGEVYSAQNDVQNAKEYFEIALEEFRSIENIIGQIDVHYHLAELRCKQQHWKSAEKLYIQALQMAQSVSAIEHVVRTMRGLGTVTAHINAKNAYTHLTQALLLADEYGLKKEQMQLHKELSVYYKMYSDPARALFHYEKYHAVRDQIISESTERRLATLKILHEVETYKAQIAEKERRLIILEQELESKTRELNALVMNIIEKRDFMEMVANGLRKIIAAHPSDKDYFAHALLESLDIENTTKKALKEFAEQFMSVHRAFIEHLLQLCPLLTPTELRVCVLLRMSLNSKHIAEILHLSLRSVENHRFHIRKKLLLDDKTNLSGFIISLA